VSGGGGLVRWVGERSGWVGGWVKGVGE
jgi:hypothetical protein